MSNKVYNWAKKLPLSRGDKHVLLVLANSYNDQKGYCCPTNKTLAKWCSCTTRTIRRHIRSLISKNLIQKEDIRDPLGRRVTHKYTFNIEQNIDNLPDKNACGQLKSLPDNLSSLPDKNDIPTGQFVQEDYITNKNKTKIKQENSLVNNFSEQQKQTEQPNEDRKIKFKLGIFFEQLVNVYGDSYNLKNAKNLFFKICLENEHPLEFAKSLITIRQQQISDFKKLINSGRPTATPPSLFKWLQGKRWLDAIKPFEQKKKLNSPYVKCACGEDMLRGQKHCSRCEGLTQRRTAYA